MPLCPYCHTVVSEDYQYCPECGRSLLVGEVVEGRSKKKVAGIIVACIIAGIIVAIIATRAPTYTLSVSISPPQTGSISSSGGQYESGTQVTLTANPANGYAFDCWSGDASGTMSSINIIMDSDKSVIAHFEVEVTLSVSVSPSGAGSVSPSEREYKSGVQLTLTASPADGYTFDHWSGNATGVSPSITINMNSDKDVTAHFRIFFSPTFSQICEGLGIPQSADYQGDEHPVVLLGSTGNKHDWSDELPIEWLPVVVEEIQLVVCVGEERDIKIETCEYMLGPNIERYQYSLHVKLREAKTGNAVAVTTLYGSPPRYCQYEEEYWLTRLEGSHVSFDQVEEWLSGYVVTSGA